MPTLDELQQWANSPTGLLLQGAGQQVANGADPAQVLASTALQLGQGQSAQDFLATQGGKILQQYIGAVSAGTPLPDAMGSAAHAAVTVGLTAGLSAVGIPPPASALLAGFIGGQLTKLIDGIINGPIDQTYGGLGDDFAWRARKYHTKCLPQAFVTWMESNNYSLSKAILNPPSGESPPWAGLSSALSTWLLGGAWGNGKYILLPGVSGAGDQLGIPYTLPADAGDGWTVPPSGWWWYPWLSAKDVSDAAAGTLPASVRGPIWDTYEKAGIDVPATIRNVRAKGSAKVENIIYKPVTFSYTADALQVAVDAQRAHKRLTPDQVQLLKDAGLFADPNKPEKAKTAQALGGLALLGLLLR